MDYVVQKGIIKSKDGIPQLPYWFAEERIAFQIDGKGISAIDYWNKTTRGSEKIFYPNLWGGIKLYLDDNGHTYAQKLANCEILPFGMTAKWLHKDVELDFEQFTVNDSIVVRIKANKQTELKLRWQYYDCFSFSPYDGADERFGGAKRTWSGWNQQGNCFVNGYTEEVGQTQVCLSGNFDITPTVSMQHSRYTHKSANIGADWQTYVLSFDYSLPAATQRCQHTLGNVDQLLAEIKGRYAAIAQKAPVFSSPYPYLDKFMALAPMFAESLKVKEYPGALRSKTTYYWVWGWDGMTANYSTVYGGNGAFLKDLLDCYMIHSDPEKGVVHAFAKDMTLASISPLPAQGMYLVILYNYFCNSGDIAPYYEFAKKIFRLTCTKEVAPYGFCEGTSLFPDFPDDMKENGNDLSGFNNTVFYCAARAMEAMADYMGDVQTAQKAHSICSSMHKYFKDLFFDKKVGYIVSSVDSKTLQKRNIFNSNSVKWENNFLADLVADIDQDALRFYVDNIVTPMGLREIPVWCDAFDQDANQLHCWWPSTGEYFARLFNKFDRQDLVEQWVKWVSLWTKRLTIPEGISCYEETDEPDFDYWNCQSGTWQAYSGRAWYEAAIQNVLGVVGDFGGLTVFPRTQQGVSVTNLHWDNKTFDISMQGEGKHVTKIVVNGVEVVGTNKIPCDLLTEHNVVVVHKCYQNELPVRIVSGYGFAISNYRHNDGEITATVQGYGHCKLNCIGNLWVDGVLSANKEIDFTTNKQRAIVIKE